MAKKNELRFQNHIIKSYKECGGKAAKWSSEWVAGPPDLVCSIAPIGCHLVEVKHVPTWQPGVIAPRKNPMTEKQKLVAREYLDAGGDVWLAVVAGSSEARGSYLGYFHPGGDIIDVPLSGWHPFELGQGFNITKITTGLWT